MEEVRLIRMADMAVGDNSCILRTIGLGSCVGVVLFNEQLKAAGMAHIMLPSTELPVSPEMKAKYATTAIPELINMLEQKGVPLLRLRAKLIGGAQMFRTLGERPDALNIGQRNVETCRELLKQYRIPIVAEDVGGNYGRTVEHYCETGRTFVKTVFKGESWI
ncbi:MAG: hypothetical protein BAA01_08305 [Bacillus thermozeamaize]|uniref:Chemoreceptor glutamine deamidase CheD n=1 Tax=Bacillus thermozeamaize TaxID=230954 RepID=A0A1Y3PM03_9BACI|nr:MAG: hypothetical protein BAA01_08305 [Bacillus thermozeamaize]